MYKFTHTHIKSSSKYTYQYMYLEDDLMCVCKLVPSLIAVAYLSSLMWSSKAVSHFSKLLAHTFPDKSPGIENVSQFLPTEIVLVMHCKNNCISVTKEWYQTGFLIEEVFFSYSSWYLFSEDLLGYIPSISTTTVQPFLKQILI